MKKKLMLLILGINIISCTNIEMFPNMKKEIKLKKEEIPRFKKYKAYENGKEIYKDVVEGTYNINLYEISYPVGIIEKNNFYINFNKFLQYLKLNKEKKYSILFEKRFYDEIEKLEKDQLSTEEKILEVEASSLDFSQKQEIINLSNNLKLSQYEGTDQEILNRQIYILYKLLNKNNFDGSNVYSELDKEFLLTELKNNRKEIIANLKNSTVEYFVKNSYENIEFNKFEDDSIYKFDKDIIISKNIQDQAIFPLDKRDVYLTDFPLELVDDLSKNTIKLKRNLLLIENEKYVGYTYNENNTILFINGKEPVHYYKNYKININKENVNIENLEEKNSNYYIGDFFK